MLKALLGSWYGAWADFFPYLFFNVHWHLIIYDLCTFSTFTQPFGGLVFLDGYFAFILIEIFPRLVFFKIVV